MMITSGTRCLLDTNVLIFGAIEGSPNFERANAFFRKIREEGVRFVLSAQNFLEYSSVMVRHYKRDPRAISADLSKLSVDPLAEIVYPTPRILRTFIRMLESTPDVFPPDLFLAATALESEVDYLVTDDRDFGKIKGIKVYNPFV